MFQLWSRWEVGTMEDVISLAALLRYATMMAMICNDYKIALGWHFFNSGEDDQGFECIHKSTLYM